MSSDIRRRLRAIETRLNAPSSRNPYAHLSDDELDWIIAQMEEGLSPEEIEFTHSVLERVRTGRPGEYNFAALSPEEEERFERMSAEGMARVRANPWPGPRP